MKKLFFTKAMIVFLVLSTGNSNVISQEVLTYNFRGNEIIINQSPMTYVDANNFCVSKGALLSSERSVDLVVSDYGSKIVKNTFWTNKEVYLGFGNVNSSQKLIDYDGANVYYRDKKIFNPEKKGLYHSTICTKEIPSNSETVKSKIPNAIQLGSIKVLPESMSSMSLKQAKAFCASLGQGWRLPTLDEIKSIKQSNIISSELTALPFWTDTKSCNSCCDSYFTYNMINSESTIFDISSKLRFVPVYSNVVQEQVSAWSDLSFEVTAQSYGPMTYEEAERFCAKMSDCQSNNWRVTTMAELQQHFNEHPDYNRIGKEFMAYENKTNYFNRDDLHFIKKEPSGTSEYWMTGYKDTKYYFYMSRKK